MGFVWLAECMNENYTSAGTSQKVWEQHSM